jgi:hypothetical protein
MHSWNRIYTEKKDYPIGSFVRKNINEQILTYNEERDIIESQRVNCYKIYDYIKKEDFIKINFQTPSNRAYQKLACKQDRSFLTQNGWKQAKDLTLEDSLVSLTENLLSEDQEQILLGSMLGDGYLLTSELKTCFRLQNSEQKDYLKWKIDNLSCLRFNYSNNRFTSDYFLFLKNYFNLFYRNDFSLQLRQKTGKLYRTFNEEIFNKINILALAVFYLDDGNFNKNAVHIGSKRFRHLQDCDFFENVLKSFKRFSLNGEILNNGYTIRLNKKSSYEFSNLIKHFVVKEMQYKLFPEHRDCFLKNSLCLESKIKRFNKVYFKVLEKKQIKKEVKCLSHFDVLTKNKTFLVGSSRNYGIITKCNEI